MAKTPVSVEHHNGSYAGGADVPVKGCKEGGGQAGRTRERRNGSVCKVHETKSDRTDSPHN